MLVQRAHCDSLRENGFLLGLKCEKTYFNIIKGKTKKMYEKQLKLYHLPGSSRQ